MSALDHAREVHRSVILQRRMGDSLLRSGRSTEATRAYANALRMLDDALRAFPDSPFDLSGDPISISQDVAAEAAELWGEREAYFGVSPS